MRWRIWLYITSGVCAHDISFFALRGSLQHWTSVSNFLAPATSYRRCIRGGVCALNGNYDKLPRCRAVIQRSQLCAANMSRLCLYIICVRMQVLLVSTLQISCARALHGTSSSFGRTIALYLLDFAPSIFICIGGLYIWYVRSVLKTAQMLV